MKISLWLAAAILAALFVIPSAKGNDKEVMGSLLQDYWNAFTTTDFKKAAAFIHPDDLEGVQRELPPVFIAFSNSDLQEAKEIAAAFFGPHPNEKWSSLTPVEAYECLNRLILVGTPQMFEKIKGSTIVADRIEENGEDATLHYQIHLQSETMEAKERFSKKDGKWWIRVREDPKDTAKKFLQIYKL